MIAAILLDVVIFTLIAWGLTTQVIIPVIRGSRLFPRFSKPAHDLSEELAEVEQEIIAEHVRHTLAQRKADLQHEKDTPDANE